MLSKKNEDLVQMQQGNLELKDFPDITEGEFHQQDHIQTGKNGGVRKGDTPPMGSGFMHDAFGTKKNPTPMGSGFKHDIFEKD